MFVVSVERGQEVVETIAKACAERSVTNAAIASLVGAVDQCTVSNMPAGDAYDDILTEYAQPMELSGTGEIRDGKPHVHCVVSGEGNAAIGGHLHRATVSSWFVRAYIAPAEA